MENRKTVLVRYQISSFNEACIYEFNLVSLREETHQVKPESELGTAQPQLVHIYYATCHSSNRKISEEVQRLQNNNEDAIYFCYQTHRNQQTRRPM